MASRTFKTSDETDSALQFLGELQDPPVDGEAYFQQKVEELVETLFNEATQKRYSMIEEALSTGDKSTGLVNIIAKLRDILK